MTGRAWARAALAVTALLVTALAAGCRERNQPPPYPPGYPGIPHPPNPTPVFVPMPVAPPTMTAPVPTAPQPTATAPQPTATAPQPTATTPAPQPTPTASTPTPAPLVFTNWVGAYGFDEACGSTAGGTGAVVGHVLRVFRKAGVLVAELDADGFQTRTRLRGLAKVQGNVMVISFTEHAPDDLFKTAYKQGETLITLVNMNGNVITLWGAYQPACTKETGREHFTKQS